MPKELADRVRDAIAGNVGALDLQQDANGEALSAEMKEAMQQMQKRMQGAFKDAMADQVDKEEVETTHQSEATVRMSDNEGSVEVKSKNGAKQVTVRDHQDQVVWSGPWDSAEEKLAAPPDVQQRVERLNLDSSFQGGGLRLRMSR
jgi:serine protease Do